MRFIKLIINIIIIGFLFQNLSFANDIIIYNFEELMNSQPVNGDTIDIQNNLTSDTSINNNFLNLDITFQGNNYSIDGSNTFSGFIFNQDTQFSSVRMLNCKGQNYSNSSFAGAIYNNAGNLEIERSAFVGNFVNAGGINFGVGGAIYNLNNGYATINSALFDSNYTNGASSYGGAIANGYQNYSETMVINDSVFNNNYSYGSVVPYGGAIYNSGIITINNTLFNNNYAEGEQGSFIYGGTLYNANDMTINNSAIYGSSAKGGELTYTFGGAIFNNANLKINNSVISNNTAESGLYADGGAIYNNTGGVTAITNSTIENNSISTNAEIGEGGGIYNSGELLIANSTFRNNLDKSGELNDIYNASSGIIEFESEGTTNILSGISGEGNIIKKDSGILNLGGTNDNYTGNFNFEDGTVNLLANSSYFNAQNTSFGNNTNFNMQNGIINNINFGNFNVTGTSKIYPDVNFNTNTMDTISAQSFSGNGTIYIPGLALTGVPEGQNIIIPFADSILKDYVRYDTSIIKTPIYNYTASYDSSDGNFDFIRGGFNPAVLAGAVAAQLSGYFTQLETYRNIFSNLDMVMIMSPEYKTSFEMKNKTAFTYNRFTASPLSIPEEKSGIWFKPYSIFESVPLKNGPDVSNVSYGTMLGGETPLYKLKNGWYGLGGGYVTYNGSHQAYDGVGIYNNGGLAGIEAAFYKKNFFTLWTINAGASSGEASSEFGKDNFVMFNTGIAQKTGYNFETAKKHLIIQPSLLMSYSFINTFNYTTASDVSINTKPLHAIHIEPQIKLIGNCKNFLQPYISVSMIWNIIDHAKFQANDVYLSNLSVKPFVQYGVGVQKRWGDRITGFFETMIRNGGRQGVALQFGLRISI